MIYIVESPFFKLNKKVEKVNKEELKKTNSNQSDNQNYENKKRNGSI